MAGAPLEEHLTAKDAKATDAERLFAGSDVATSKAVIPAKAGIHERWSIGSIEPCVFESSGFIAGRCPGRRI
jgi:hypothetical protein